MATPVQIQVVVDPSSGVAGFKAIGDASTQMGEQAIAAIKASTAALEDQIKATLKGDDAVRALTKAYDDEQASIAAVNQRIRDNMAAQNAAAEAAAKAAKAQAAAQAAALAAQERAQLSFDRASARASAQFQGLASDQTKASVAGRLFEQQLGISNRALNQVIARSSVLGPLLANLFEPAVIAAGASAFLSFGTRVVAGLSAFGNALVGNTEEIQRMGEEAAKVSQDAFWNPATLGAAMNNLRAINQQVEQLRKAPLTAGTGLLNSGLLDVSPQVVAEGKLEEIDAKRVVSLEHMTELAKARNALFDTEIAKTNEIGKQGFALLQQKEADFKQSSAYFMLLRDQGSAIEQTRKDANALMAMHDKQYAEERLALERDVTQQTIALRHQVDDEALTGTAKVYADEAFALNQLSNLKARGLIDEANFQDRRILIYQGTSAKLAAMEAQAEQQTEQMEKKARDADLSGNELILADKQDEINKELKLYANHEISVQQFLRRIVSINLEANKQISANDSAEADKRKGILEKDAEDQRAAEATTALASVDPWRKAYAQIEIEKVRQLAAIDQAQRVALARDKGDLDLMNADNSAAQAKRVAVFAEANEKIRAENLRLTEQLGADLQSVFDDISSGNIGKRILSNIEKLFFQILAQWILSLNMMKSTAGSILGSIIFGPNTTGSNVFGGGGNLLGGLLGAFGLGGSSASAQGTSAASSSASFTMPGITPGIGLATSFAGVGALPGAGLFSTSNALTTSTIAGGAGNAIGGGVASSAATAGKAGGGLSSLFSAQSLNSLGPLAVTMLGALGGKVGMLGGALSAGSLSIIPNLLAKLGVLGPALPAISLALGAVGAGLTGFGIGTSQGGLLGSLTGAGSGALTGFMIGGPVGAAVGAIVGLLGGIFGGIFGGNKRKAQATNFADNSVLPAVAQILQGFDTFSIDSASANKQLEDLRKQAETQLNALKSQGKDVLNREVEPAINDAERHILNTQTERDRRAAINFGPPQFETGGMFSLIRGKAGLAILHDGEFVVNAGATKKNRRNLEKINAGGTAGFNIAGDFVIHAAGPLDRAYVKNPNGFKKDLLDTLNQMRREGVI